MTIAWTAREVEHEVLVDHVPLVIDVADEIVACALRQEEDADDGEEPPIVHHDGRIVRHAVHA